MVLYSQKLFLKIMLVIAARWLRLYMSLTAGDGMSVELHAHCTVTLKSFYWVDVAHLHGFAVVTRIPYPWQHVDGYCLVHLDHAYDNTAFLSYPMGVVLKKKKEPTFSAYKSHALEVNAAS